MLKVLDLFSGIGGFSLGLERTGGFKTVAFCEIDPFCQKILKKHWPEIPIYEDVRTCDYDGPIDVICGGYPCQPFSLAGKRKGKEDDRHLWPTMFSLIKKHRPDWVLGENVAGHISMGLDSVLADLESEDYKCRTFIIPACALDAKHRRDRLWIVAHHNTRQHNRQIEEICTRGNASDAGSENVGNTAIKGLQDGRCRSLGKSSASSKSERSGIAQTMADTESKRIQRLGTSGQQKPHTHGCKGLSMCQNKRPKYANWKTEPSVGRVANGIPNRVDRLKSLGNAVVPQIPEMIGHAILQSK